MQEKKSIKRKIIFWSILSTTLILFSVIYFKYYYVYSEGSRVGILYKFSKKGTAFKTYEGEMILPGLKYKHKEEGISSNIFNFSVTDEELAKELMSSQGMEIEVHYLNYNASLPWRGDTYIVKDGQYIVDRLIRIKNKNPNGYGL